MSAPTAPLRYWLTIEGMGCSACAEAVREALAAFSGVHAIVVDPEAGSADLRTYSALQAAEVASALEDAGYSLRSMELVGDVT